jgi:Carbohydrate-selective porin, OprB family
MFLNNLILALKMLLFSNIFYLSSFFVLFVEPINALQIAATPMEQIPSVSEISNVKPSDWAFQALQSLNQRYPIVKGDLKAFPEEIRTLTRDEFAAALNTFLISLQDYNKKQQVASEDLATIKRLQAEFASELAVLDRRTNSLESRIAVIEDRQFSPTTTLTGEAILALSDDFGEEAEDNLTFQQRIQLSLRTSFTGEDRLRLTLRGGNFKQFGYVEKLTYEGRLGFETDTNNRIELSNISYQFPIGDRLDVFIAPQGDDVEDTNPYFGDRGTGSISRFGRQNPIYRLVESGGIGLEYDFSDELSL